MRLLDVARVLRQDADSARAAVHFLEALRTSPAPPLEDVASVAQRFARHLRPPGPELFHEVSSHVDRSLRGGANNISGTTVAVLADTFAQARCGTESVDTLRLACLGVNARAGISGQELLRFLRACLELGAQNDHSIRSFLKLRCDAVASSLEGCDLAEAGRLMAQARIFSASLSDEIAIALDGNPWIFNQSDLMKLLPHFHVWRLGPLQKKAFQRLALRLGEVTELLSAADAMEVVNVYTTVGSVNEVLLQHMHLRLLLERSFTELPDEGIAQLAGSMAEVSYYHTGLLREIVAHIGERPQIVAAWSQEGLYGALKSFGLAPIELSLPLIRMLGCRYNSLLAEGDADDGRLAKPLRNFFEVAAFFPELLRTVLERGGGRRLALLLQGSAAHWGPRPCADAMLAIAEALDVPPGASPAGQGCACSVEPDAARALPRRRFRSEQPDWQLRVVYRASRTWKQMERPGKQHFVQRAVHPDLPHSKAQLKDLWLVGDDGRGAAAALLPGSGRCAAEWALPGRRHSALQRRDSGTDAAYGLLQAMLPRLLLSLQDTGRDLAEVPGAVPSMELLEYEGYPEEMPKLLPYGGGLEKPPAPAGQLQLEANQLQLEAGSEGGDAGGGSGGGAEGAGAAAAADDAPAREGGPAAKPAPRSTPPDREVMRRSELVQVCVQTLAALQLCLVPGSVLAKPALSMEMLRAMGQLSPLVGHILRPRRLEDEAIQRFNLGPLRMEAFVRRPNEPMVMEVYQTLHGIMPFLPKLTGWTLWEPRKDDILEGERTGGAIVTVNREVEVPPFIVCLVLRRKAPAREREWGAGTGF